MLSSFVCCIADSLLDWRIDTSCRTIRFVSFLGSHLSSLLFVEPLLLFLLGASTLVVAQFVLSAFWHRICLAFLFVEPLLLFLTGAMSLVGAHLALSAFWDLNCLASLFVAPLLLFLTGASTLVDAHFVSEMSFI